MTTTDWRHNAVCHEEDPELFFPIGDTGPALLQIKEAKAVCSRCPVIGQCQEWALDHSKELGVWGGLSEADRRSIQRRAARQGTTAQEAASGPRIRYATIAAAIAARSTVEDGHQVWTGSVHFTIDGVRYVARRAAFQETHGRPPVGPVGADCNRRGCISHLNDREIRERCGTLAGYRRHHANGETPCRPCLDANTDADRRLRNGGTSKQLVA